MSRELMRRLVLAAGLLASGAGAWAQESQPNDPRIVSDTGIERAVWPPATPWDHIHMLLELDFGAFDIPAFNAVQTLTLTPRGKARDVVELDCGPDITIDRITLAAAAGARGKDGKPSPDTELKHEREGRKLRIALPAEVAMGQEITLKTRYKCDFSKNRNVGLTWVAPRADAASETDKNPVAYSQGQSEDNNRWFPCHDFPNERLTTEIIATVPAGYEVCSNGRLVEKTTSGDTATFHWLQDQHHVNYLVTLVVGKYSIINLAGEGAPDMSSARRDGKPLPITAYVPIGKEDACLKTLGKTPAMITCFEKLFGVAYPWDKYTQVLVRGFPGGMENTSATTMGANPFANGRFADDLVAHELAHQWFGDLVTCRGWEHIWLNEGWATYCEALWEEYKDGQPDDEAYLKKIAGDVSAQRGMNRGALPRSVPMVSNRYSDPDAPFSKPDNPYSKGSVVLHMLRERVGREAFFRGVHNYLVANRESGLVDTDTFRKFIEQSSGQSLDAFFDQWTKRPGFPRLDIKLAYDAEKKTLKIDGEQVQTVDADNPPYVLEIPVEIRFEGQPSRMEMLRMDAKTFTAEFGGVAGKPSGVVLDPRITNLAVYRVTQGLE